MSTEYQAIGNPPAGSIRFNTDSSKMEIYNGEAWWEIDATSPELQTGGTRSLWAGGNTPTYFNNIQFVSISTTGNTADFGDLSSGVRYGLGSLSNAIRGVIGGGDVYPSPGRVNHIDFITIATLGDSIDFGDQTDTFHYGTATGSSTRGVFAGGNAPGLINSMCYIQIMTTGDAIDFGDLTDQIDTMTGCSNGNGGLG